MRLKEIVAKYPTEQDFIKAVEEQLLLLAKEQPSFRYNTSGELATCRYNGPATKRYDYNEMVDALIVQVGPDCKGCLFGQALQNLGWDDAIELTSGMTIDIVLGFISDKSRLNLWRQIQGSQDGGKTWSEAVSVLTYHQQMHQQQRFNSY